MRADALRLGSHIDSALPVSERRSLDLPGDDDVSRWLAAIDDARQRTLALIRGLSEADLDRGAPNTIGSLLYHLAAIEADWLFDDIRGEPEAIPVALFAHDVREAAGTLTPITGVTLGEHLDRLATIRRALVEHIGALDSGSFHRSNARAAYDVSPAYAIHHLMQHEAEHRAEMGRVVAGMRP